MASVLIDLLCLVLLCGYLALEMLAGHYHIADEFIFEHVNALWATYSALVDVIHSLKINFHHRMNLPNSVARQILSPV